MFSGYEELNQLTPDSFLLWENFRTHFDAFPNREGYKAEQYQTGLRIGAESRYVFISCNSTWGSVGKDGKHTTSYEGIGYHAGTSDLLKGFLDSGVPIVVFRLYDREEGPITETWIQGDPQPVVGRP